MVRVSPLSEPSTVTFSPAWETIDGLVGDLVDLSVVCDEHRRGAALDATLGAFGVAFHGGVTRTTLVLDEARELRGHGVGSQTDDDECDGDRFLHCASVARGMGNQERLYRNQCEFRDQAKILCLGIYWLRHESTCEGVRRSRSETANRDLGVCRDVGCSLMVPLFCREARPGWAIGASPRFDLPPFVGSQSSAQCLFRPSNECRYICFDRCRGGDHP